MAIILRPVEGYWIKRGDSIINAQGEETMLVRTGEQRHHEPEEIGAVVGQR